MNREIKSSFFRVIASVKKQIKKILNSRLGIDAMWRAGKLTVGSCDGKTLVSWIGVPRLSFPLRR